MKKKEHPDLSAFKIAATKLLARKIYLDYSNAVMEFRTVEPEHFVDEWIYVHLSCPEEPFERSIWKFFLENLQLYKGKPPK